MIVEGYELHLYCDGAHEEWELGAVYGLPCTAEFGGRNRRAAWNDAYRLGWTKKRRKVFCPDCSRTKESK